MAPLFAEAGFPPGVVQFLTGARETGALLSSHQRIAKISFTGSIAAGRAVQEAATNSNLKKVTLELGGKSAAVVFDDVDFDLCVDWYAFLTFILVEQYLIWHLSVGGGFLANSGQICVGKSDR